MIERIARDTAIACVVIAVLFALWKRDLASPLGVIGGGLLIGLSFWAIRGTVDTLIATACGPPRDSGDAAEAGETGRISHGFRASEVFHKAWYIGSRGLRYDGAFAPGPGGSTSGCVVARRCRRGRSAQRFEMEAFSVRTSRLLLSLMFGFVVLGLASPVYAQEAAAMAADSGLVQWSIVTAGFALAIAAFGAALGQGKAVASATEAIARNPGAAGEIRGALILGLVLIESLVIYVLLVSLILFFIKPFGG